MFTIPSNRFNPNPITKFFVVGLLGFTGLNIINHYLEWAAVFVISIMYFANGFKKESMRNIIVFGILFLAPSFTMLEKFPIIVKILFSLVLVVRMFYLPFTAAKFMIKTSDVGSIISAMESLKIPNVVSIPIAVMFRFFPTFIEEKNHIKMAMKIRGIETKNPFKYLEYVSVPLLIISSNIADDVAKAAETRCIANPIKKTRYIRVGFHAVDFIYAIVITIIVVGGLLCSH